METGIEKSSEVIGYPENFNNFQDISNTTEHHLISDKINYFFSNDSKGAENKENADVYYAGLMNDIGVQNIPYITGVEAYDHYITLYYFDENDKEIARTYDLLATSIDDMYAGSTYTEIYNKQQEALMDIPRYLEEMDNILQMMEEVFLNNEKKPGFGYINKFDTLRNDAWPKTYQGMDLKQLESLFVDAYRKKMGASNILRHGESIHKKAEISLYKRYVTMSFGVGNTYEGGAKYIPKQRDIVNSIFSSLINMQSNQELLEYIKELHQQIDNNDWQSSAVKKAYQDINIRINDGVLSKFESNINTLESDYLEFVKIISGKYEADDGLKYSDSTMKTANIVMEKLVYKSGGIMDKMTDSTVDSFIDPEMSARMPGGVVEELIGAVTASVQNKEGDSIDFKGALEKLGYGDILNLSNKKYLELNLEQKSKISVLVRVLQQFELRNDFRYEMKKLSVEDLSEIFRLVSVQAQEDLVENITDVFQDGEGLKEFLYGKELNAYMEENEKISKTDKEIFDFFKDFQGIGALQMSDRSWGNTKEGAKLTATIVSAVIAPYIFASVAGATVGATTVVGGLRATHLVVNSYNTLHLGAGIGATASMASMAMNPTGYDSLGEGVFDVTTDIVTGALTGAIGGKIIQSYGVASTRFLSPADMQNKGIFIADLLVLGLGAEILRTMGVERIFQKDSLYE